jgi:hypothetical protein
MNQYLFDREIDALLSVDDLDAMIDEALQSPPSGGGGPGGSGAPRIQDFRNLLTTVIRILRQAIQHLRSTETRNQAVPLMGEAIRLLTNANLQVPTFLAGQEAFIQRHLENIHREIHQAARLTSGDPRIPVMRGSTAIQSALNAAGRRGVSPLHNSLRELLRLLRVARQHYQPPVISRDFLATLQTAGQSLQQAQQQVPAFFAARRTAIPRALAQIQRRIRNALNSNSSGNNRDSIIHLEAAIRILQGLL